MRAFEIVAILAASLAAAILPCYSAEPQLKPIVFSETTLPNGLRVILAPDHHAPVFGISVDYKVGSADERPGLTGFAHLFEHMMFEGSKNVGKGEHFIVIGNNGGGVNGQTHEDFTNYYEKLPSNQLDLALFLESDRMRSLAVTQANLDNQRSAVKEEIRLKVDNQPYVPSEEEIDNLAYDNFAYKHSAFGLMSDLDRATLKDVQDFFHSHYLPNNAILVLAGDFDPDAALKKIKKYFGGIATGKVPPSPNLGEPEHLGERRETVKDPLARLPSLLAAYHIPPGNTSDNYALQALGIILGQGASSRLYQTLVKEQQLATSVSTGPDDRQGPSLFYIEAMPRPGVPLERLEEAVYREIEAVKNEGITDEELAKARRQFLIGHLADRETYLSEAVAIGEDAAKFGEPGLINSELDKFNTVTRAQVQAATARYLIPKERAVVLTLPGQETPKTAEARP